MLLSPSPTEAWLSKSHRTTRKVSLDVQALEGREVPASGLGVASDFNAFVLHDFNGFYSDIQGRVAVGGNATITGYSVGDGLSNSNSTRDDLIVGGNLKYTNGQVFNGNVVHGGTGTFDMFGHPNGTIRQGNPIDFNAAQTELNSLSTNWSQLATTGTFTSQWGIVTLKGTSPTLNVFNIQASDLWNANTLNIEAAPGATVLVNVNGSDARLQYMGMNIHQASSDHIVFNFPNATHLKLEGIGFLGNILAPAAQVNFNNGQMVGTLVASSFCGNGELHTKPPEIVINAPPAVCTSNLSGYVWRDKNKDGIWNPGECAMANVKVTFFGTDKDGNSVTRTTTTDRKGQYQFSGLLAGTYSITVTLPPKYKTTGFITGDFGGTGNKDANTIENLVIPSLSKTSAGYDFGLGYFPT